MLTIVCALVGVKGSAFSVDVDENKLVDHLKDKIAEKQKLDIVASELQLFLAKKDDAWLPDDDPVAQQLEEGNTDDDEIKKMRGGGRMMATRGIQEWMDDKNMPPPQRRQIHVLVVVPEGARGAEATTPLTAEQTKMAVNEVLEERDRKRSEYSISTCPRSKETLLKQQLGLEYSAVPVNEVFDDSIHGYQWSALPEKHPDQRKAYMKYVDEHLRDALISRRKQKDFLKDVAGKRDLLDCDDRNRLPFKVKGTADMMIIDELANRMDDVFAGLRFVIEVKKDHPSYNERWQLLLELVVADLKSEGRCAPVGLLTNLNDYWYFLWFTTDNKIARMVLTCPANGFKTMKEILKERSGPKRDGHFPMQVAGSPLPLKRQKLLKSAIGRDDAAAEMLERYELMSDELSPKFLQERRMDYAFHLISQMPIHSSMYS
ncbi:hypothetical protein P3T76_001872 [Phytophthora citrophthora]|uniref:Crinkler effector protein N-terminal domain-containing protein n=1 Tax=Phytophthora citrophthora TaxID=4793 RepID=A0AAD9GWC2_9STRA|nr:hypothetical protein P3T76_001872 [Phytophthora citrophthora]